MPPASFSLLLALLLAFSSTSIPLASAAVSDLQGQIRITYMTKYALDEEVERVFNLTDKRLLEGPDLSIPAGNPGPDWPSCVVQCSHMNYSGRRCAFVYTPADTDTDAVKKCFLSSEELGDLTLAEKNDAGAREIRVLNVIDGVPT